MSDIPNCENFHDVLLSHGSVIVCDKNCHTICIDCGLKRYPEKDRFIDDHKNYQCPISGCSNGHLQIVNMMWVERFLKEVVYGPKNVSIDQRMNVFCREHPCAVVQHIKISLFFYTFDVGSDPGI